MAPRFKAWSVGSSSTDSSDEESISREDGGPRSVKEDKERPKQDGAKSAARQMSPDVARREATNFQLPNLQPHQHSALFHLSLIEGRCKTQAANSINATRLPEDALPEDHPEVRELARHLFMEMSRELSKAGLLPAEFAGPELADLRASYLSTFDQILDGIASKRTKELSEGPDAPAQTLDLVRRGVSTLQLGIPQALATTRFATPKQPINTLFNGTQSSAVAMAAEHITHCFQNYSEQIEIGHGAYGCVKKARHPLDGIEYAIKELKMPKRLTKQAGPLTLNKLYMNGVLNELRSLAKLDHRNVVRYFNSWFEILPESPNHTTKPQKALTAMRHETTSDIPFEPSAHSGDDGHIKFEDSDSANNPSEITGDAHEQDQDDEDSDSAKEISGTTSNAHEQDQDDDDSDGTKNTWGTTSNAHEQDQDEDSSGGFKNTPGTSSNAQTQGQSDDTSNNTQVNLKNIRLYIQMALHDGSLSEFLSLDPPKADSSLPVRHCYHKTTSIQLLKCILDGLEHCHRATVIHRDLKPPNVLLSIRSEPHQSGYVDLTKCPDCAVTYNSLSSPKYLTPCLTDFGLIAKIPDENASHETSLQVVPQASHKQAGTPLYQAPDRAISPKLDIYSLGMIAFELLYKFGSDSERRIVLNDLRQGIFPEDFKYYEMAAGIKAMMDPNPEQRWDCARVREWLKEMEVVEEEEGEGEIVRNGS